MNYESEIVLGETYRDQHTKYQGVAIAITFYEHACPRVSIRCLVDHKVVDQVFDAPHLVPVTENGGMGFSG
jgi:hypothetical protein